MAFDADMHHQYMPSHWSTRKDCMDDFLKTMEVQSEIFRRKYQDSIQTVSYGNLLGQHQKMDIVMPQHICEDAPIFVFIHGGYWSTTPREMYLCVLKNAVEKGYIGVNLGFDQAPQVSLATIVEEIRESYPFLCKRFPKSRHMIIQGHSSGAHLACMILSTNWKTYPKLEHRIPISQCIPISGVYDLRPIVHVDVGADLKLTTQDVRDLSPILNVDAALSNMLEFKTKVTSVVAQHDPPMFKEKGNEYVQALRDGRACAEQIELDKFDHFNIITDLINPEHPIHKILVHVGKEHM